MERFVTLERFLENRSDLPDAGQWSELVRGVPVQLSPPDLDHGTIVLNLSKAFSQYIHETLRGYACFDMGLHVEKDPDTIFFPAVSYFNHGERFAESDHEVSHTIPELVIELLTTSDRRRTLNDRLSAYQKWGVESIWLIDPQQQALHAFHEDSPHPRRYNSEDLLTLEPVLPDFSLPIESLFQPPQWAR